MIRPAQVVLPLLRAALPGASVVSGFRTWTIGRSLVLVRRAGGPRLAKAPRLMSLPEIELSVYSDEGLVECEQLYEDALEALYAAQHAQTVVPDVGYLHSIREAQGATDASPRSQTVGP